MSNIKTIFCQHFRLRSINEYGRRNLKASQRPFSGNVLVHVKESPSSLKSTFWQSSLNFIGWIYVLDSSEKQKTSKPVKLEVYAIQIYMYCYAGYFAHK